MYVRSLVIAVKRLSTVTGRTKSNRKLITIDVRINGWSFLVILLLVSVRLYQIYIHKVHIYIVQLHIFDVRFFY